MTDSASLFCILEALILKILNPTPQELVDILAKRMVYEDAHRNDLMSNFLEFDGAHTCLNPDDLKEFTKKYCQSSLDKLT